MPAASDPSRNEPSRTEDVQIESISAITLLTHDIRASITFYESLGLTMAHGGPLEPLTSFKIGGGFLNLLKSDAPVPQAEWGRVILYVSDVDAMYRRCVSMGYEPSSQPTDAPWGERFFHLRDPAGHELSFARPLE